LKEIGTIPTSFFKVEVLTLWDCWTSCQKDGMLASSSPDVTHRIKKRCGEHALPGKPGKRPNLTGHDYSPYSSDDEDESTQGVSPSRMKLGERWVTNQGKGKSDPTTKVTTTLLG